MLYAKCANSPDGGVTRFRETAPPQKFYLRYAPRGKNTGIFGNWQ